MNTITLPVNTIDKLHQWLPFDSGTLFPFGLDNSSPDGRIEAMLIKGGFLGKDAKLSDNSRDIFSVISESESTSRLSFLSEGDLLDYQVFFSKDKNRAVSIKRGEAEFIAANPAPTEDLIDILTEFTGTGAVGVVPAKWLLTFDESVFAAAMVDLLRKKLFASLAEDKSEFTTSLTIGEIETEVARQDGSARHLGWVVKSYISEDMEFSLEKAISGLSQKNIIKQEGKSITPSTELAITARRLLHLKNLFMIDKFEVINDSAQKSRICVVQNGLRDLLMFETDGKSIGWQGISSMVFLSLIHKFFSPADFPTPSDNTASRKPENLSVPDRMRPENVSKKSSFCTKCGNTLKSGAKFCPKCGNTIN